MSVSTGDSLMRQCVLVLDAICSQFNCVEFITTLQRIEANLFSSAYKNFNDFQNELLTISQITPEFLNSIELCVENKVPEEYCTTPIYSSIQYHEQSVMYSVNIKSYHQLHSSLYDALKNPSNLPLHRLYIIKNGHFLLNARDSIHNFITLFFDVETNQSDENPDISFIKANIATVHPVGELHTSTLDTFEGWIKVKIAHSKTIRSIIPTALAERLFEKKEQMPRKISIKSATDLITARQNELTRQFLIHVTGSRVKEIEPCYHINLKNLLQSSPNEYTPSSLNMSNSIPRYRYIRFFFKKKKKYKN
ncbi:hypothetical protein BDF21DRAFT_110324 [Thamnidium elegans]|nr:hypothetical protein BDF21DRAFT_110324 [Thamnidium elegans]